MTRSTIADLTLDEFKGLIKEAVSQTLLELLGDPDERLELREEIITRLQNSSANLPSKSTLTSAQEMAGNLELKW